ncbi:CHAT domain-containing protein [Streptomyces sp. UNOB3_S3]|uniref:CHAT domain-containing protein n=1 Tax=Streptomyces sp. UNOB3_S3 TaxID=2871682 RepID=UPI001E41D413|nr:CHAT domain-containing protein [Streptomyces sp. UNOB3_S3]MCC3778200.1 CHAT domain-containing protein [Streptomyces sp. UNOB3_S3]
MVLTKRGGEALGDAPDGAAWLLTFLAGSLLPELLSVQRSVSQAADIVIKHERLLRRAKVAPSASGLTRGLTPEAVPPTEVLEIVRAAEDMLLDRFTAPDPQHPLFASVRAALRLCLADLWYWAGDADQAEERHQAARAAAPDDTALQGWAVMLSGDWALGLQAGAEQRRPAEELPRAADLGVADQLWAESSRLYREARCSRGEAAALLRRAHIARLHGSAGRSELLRDAERLAARAADGALCSLIQVHGWLDRIEDGTDVLNSQCASVRKWGVTHGGDSWLRGLSALLSAQATRWSSAGDALRAAQAERLAAALVGESAAQAAKHGAEAAKHQLSEVVLAEEELTRCETVLSTAEELHKGDQPHGIAHVNAMQAGLKFAAAAAGLADPGLLTLAADRGEGLLGRGPQHERPPAAPPAGDKNEQLPFSLVPFNSPDSIRAYSAYCRARAAALAGLEEQTQRSAEHALSLAVECWDIHTLFVTLILRRRMDEARLLIDELEQFGALDACMLTRFRMMAGQAQEAARAARGLDEWEHAFGGRLWEILGLKAEVREANGDYPGALRLAEEAINHYEAHRTRLARDALRSTLANDTAVMSLFHTAVLSHLALDGATREGTGVYEGGPGARAAFALAERVRSGFLDNVRALDVARGAEENRAVRAWLCADSRWSAVYEDQVARLRRQAFSLNPADIATTSGGSAPDPAKRRQQAERELAEAESAVRQTVPAALTAWRGTQRTTVEEVAASLPPGVLLLQYHLFDEDLVAWAITSERLRVVRTKQWAVAMAGKARRFHSWCSGLDRNPAPGVDLAKLLLEPFARELRDHQRVLLAPPPRLFLLPFQALPWEGGTLGDRRTLSHLPAASVLTRRPPGTAPSTAWSALLVGDPATDPAAGLVPIPGTAVEVHHTAALFPGSRVLTGAQAALGGVSKEAAGRGIVHLAAHGLVDEHSPNRNHLALAGHDKLSVGDLYGLHTYAGPELLVLSGCHTGRGTASGGDVLGLARSALMAGARHAVVSLWPVDDRGGCLTMVRMYRHLAAARSHLPDGPGPGVAQALAEAQREVRALTAGERDAEYAALAAEAGCPTPVGAGRGTVRDSGPAPAPLVPPEHPFHWAPFIHIGTQEATE